MNGPSIGRRRLLRTGGTALSAAALTGLAGCAALEKNEGRAADLPAYAEWAPAPGRVLNPSAEVDWYPFRARRFDALAAHLDERGEPFEDTALYQNGMAHPVVDVPPSEAGLELRAGGRGLAVLETGLDDERIVEAFRTPEADRDDTLAEAFERVGEYEGYELLAHPDGNWVAGVDDGVVVEAFESGLPNALREKRSVVEATIDARAGDGRYVDANEDVAAVVRRLGGGMDVRVEPPPATDDGSDGEPVATGVGYTDAGDGVRDGRWVLVFESVDAAEAHDIDTSAGADPAGPWTDVSVERDGRTLVVTGRSDGG